MSVFSRRRDHETFSQCTYLTQLNDSGLTRYAHLQFGLVRFDATGFFKENQPLKVHVGEEVPSKRGFPLGHMLSRFTTSLETLSSSGIAKDFLINA